MMCTDTSHAIINEVVVTSLAIILHNLMQPLLTYGIPQGWLEAIHYTYDI